MHTPAAALNAAEQWPESLVTYQPTTGKAKPSLGDTQFINLRWNISSKNERADGWFKFENARLHRGIVPKDKAEGTEAKFESSRLVLRLKASQLGDFGKFLMLAEPEWQKLAQKLKEDGVIVYNHKHDIHPLVYLTYGDKHKIEELRGKPNPDPTIRIKLDFGRYSEKYAPPPMIKGAQKTQIFDATKPYLDNDKKLKYKVATVTGDDGKEEEVNANNVHKLLTEGSMVSGLIHIPSLVVSASWVSAPTYISKLYVAPGTANDFDDDIAPPVGATTLNLQEVAPVDPNDVNAFLNAM
jgi:hypothetical protein